MWVYYFVNYPYIFLLFCFLFGCLYFSVDFWNSSVWPWWDSFYLHCSLLVGWLNVYFVNFVLHCEFCFLTPIKIPFPTLKIQNFKEKSYIFLSFDKLLSWCCFMSHPFAHYMIQVMSMLSSSLYRVCSIAIWVQTPTYSLIYLLHIGIDMWVYIIF